MRKKQTRFLGWLDAKGLLITGYWQHRPPQNKVWVEVPQHEGWKLKAALGLKKLRPRYQRNK